jgi:hypothetical protein
VGYTPGPWFVERGHDEDGAETETLHICHAGTVCENTTVCQVWNDAEANARLIAAAPELYDELADAAKVFRMLSEVAEEVRIEGAPELLAAAERAEAILAKARGGSMTPPCSSMADRGWAMRFAPLWPASHSTGCAVFALRGPAAIAKGEDR